MLHLLDGRCGGASLFPGFSVDVSVVVCRWSCFANWAHFQWSNYSRQKFEVYHTTPESYVQCNANPWYQNEMDTDHMVVPTHRSYLIFIFCFSGNDNVSWYVPCVCSWK